jgi:NADH:ubiquinone oxidoreductase subunit 5 (subunit L)/multisubunit Na+/H+ antiporter MnhA subunit
MVINKVGDCCFLLGVALLFQKLGAIDLGSLKTLDIGSYYYLLLSENFFGFEVSGAFPALLFLFLGVMAKSAQFGFHTWLPDAMEGPTPVSALIHAATMVTAGVFLLLRVSSLVVLSSSIQLIITTVGLLTMVFAATSALFQNDIKRVIAYSTCSQLGYMIAACGYSFFGAAFFHLLSHAFFKALLFLCAGSIIHYFSDEQDMRRIWSVPLRTVTAVCLSVSSLSLMGFPFTSGFFSKDYILELLASQGFHAAFGYSVGLSAAVLTVAYSILLMLRV